jgi:putative PIN family toxin of toxin-antitoxin system
VRVFLDTNVLFSAFATRGLSADLFELVLNQHELVTGVWVPKELDKAFRLKLRLSDDRCAENVDIVRSKAVVIAEAAKEADCEADQADRIVLGEALAGGAEVFVTGDASLLALKRVSGMPIQGPRQFWDSMRTR